MQISEHYKSQLHRPSYINSVKCFRISMLLVFLYVALSVHCSDFSCSYLAMVAHFQFSIRHAFDCITPVCICGSAKEDNEHFFLHCPQYHGLRVDLFDQISDIPGIDLTYFDESSLCNLLLYGNPSCTEIHNSIIIESTITYINATGRFI